jgi:hypothetical protein
MPTGRRLPRRLRRADQPRSANSKRQAPRTSSLPIGGQRWATKPVGWTRMVAGPSRGPGTHQSLTLHLFEVRDHANGHRARYRVRVHPAGLSNPSLTGGTSGFPSQWKGPRVTPGDLCTFRARLSAVVMSAHKRQKMGSERDTQLDHLRSGVVIPNGPATVSGRGRNASPSFCSAPCPRVTSNAGFARQVRQ